MLKVIQIGFSMKKISISLLCLMFLNSMSGMSAKMEQPFSDKINEHDAKVVVPPEKTATTLFDSYQRGNIEEVAKEFADHGNALGKMSEIKDESVAREDWTTAQQALRDEKLLKGAVAGEKKNI